MATPLREITAEELAQHNTPQSLWFDIKGQVLDVTKFQVRCARGGGCEGVWAGG